MLALLGFFHLFCISHLIRFVQSLSPPSSRRVFVYDNVMTDAGAQVLGTALASIGQAHFVYDRTSRSPRSTVEATLDHLCTQLQDNSPIIEYWARSDWMNLDAHRDVDEYRAKRDDKSWALTFPTNAHVIYLQIGEDVRGPTCLFFEESMGISQITTVPAKNCRLLRFDGDVIHAVPRPPLAYLDPEQGGSNLEIFSRVRDEAVLNPAMKRQVLLFNTWQTRPESVNEIEIEGHSQQPQSVAAAHSSWSHVDIIDAPEQAMDIHLKVGILGDKRRRFRANSTWMHLYAGEGIKESMSSDDAVFSIAAKEKC